MPVPDYQTLMLPLLNRLARAAGPTTVRDHMESVADEFGLSEAERTERIPSGQENLLANRLHWARTYMGKAGLTVSPKRGLVEITARGRELLAENPTELSNSVLARYPEFVAWLGGQGVRREQKANEGRSEPDSRKAILTPREEIGQAIQELERALETDLLDRVRQMTAAEFEGLILKLLLAMNYGQGMEEMALALGGTGDGGMDGVIHQDPLGLERVYVQAKRYKEGSGISSADIRNFIGALNIHRANKGVFVTASHFTSDAKTAAKGSTVQVVLIDGARLADLMVRYKVGVLTRSVIEIRELDEGFFST